MSRNQGMFVWGLAVATLLIVALTTQLQEPASALPQGQTARGGPMSSVFIRWGNDTAPPGTKLIYSGYAYANHNTHSGQNQPIVFQSGDPGPGNTNPANLFYALETGSGIVPPGVTIRSYLVAAVCEAPSTTTTIWGTHTAPPGWTVVYRGYGMGSFYNQEGSVGPICVDTDAFDSSHASTGSQSIIYGTSMWGPSPDSGDPNQAFVKCAVIMKM